MTYGKVPRRLTSQSWRQQFQKHSSFKAMAAGVSVACNHGTNMSSVLIILTLIWSLSKRLDLGSPLTHATVLQSPICKGTVACNLLVAGISWCGVANLNKKCVGSGIDEGLLAEAEQVLDLAKGIGIDEKPEVLKERLFDAINDGEVSIARACLDANAETSVRLPIDVVDEDGNTPLSEAACYGEKELVEFFLSRGAHPDSRNELGRTPIWRACYNGHYEVVKMLLENGADKSIASNTGDEPGKQLCYKTISLWDTNNHEQVRIYSMCFDRHGSMTRSARGFTPFESFWPFARHGTPETKALIAGWDPQETERLKQVRNLGAWKPAEKKTARAKPVVEAELTPSRARVSLTFALLLIVEDVERYSR